MSHQDELSRAAPPQHGSDQASSHQENQTALQQNENMTASRNPGNGAERVQPLDAYPPPSPDYVQPELPRNFTPPPYYPPPSPDYVPSELPRSFEPLFDIETLDGVMCDSGDDYVAVVCIESSTDLQNSMEASNQSSSMDEEKKSMLQQQGVQHDATMQHQNIPMGTSRSPPDDIIPKTESAESVADFGYKEQKPGTEKPNLQHQIKQEVEDLVVQEDGSMDPMLGPPAKRAKKNRHSPGNDVETDSGCVKKEIAETPTAPFDNRPVSSSENRGQTSVGSFPQDLRAISLPPAPSNNRLESGDGNRVQTSIGSHPQDLRDISLPPSPSSNRSVSSNGNLIQTSTDSDPGELSDINLSPASSNNRSQASSENRQEAPSDNRPQEPNNNRPEAQIDIYRPQEPIRLRPLANFMGNPLLAGFPIPLLYPQAHFWNNNQQLGIPNPFPLLFNPLLLNPLLNPAFFALNGWPIQQALLQQPHQQGGYQPLPPPPAPPTHPPTHPPPPPPSHEQYFR